MAQEGEGEAGRGGGGMMERLEIELSVVCSALMLGALVMMVIFE